jgi:hypothetical protein
MNAVDSGLWPTQYQTWIKNQNWIAVSAISNSKKTRQLQRSNDLNIVEP